MSNEQSADRVRRVHQLSMAVADRLVDRFPPDQTRSLRGFISVGEYGLFAETLCATLAERGIAVTRDEYAYLSALSGEVEGSSYQPSRYLSDVVISDVPQKFYFRPPENFYDMSEEDQLAWTRQLGQHLAARADREDSDGKGEPPSWGTLTTLAPKET